MINHIISFIFKPRIFTILIALSCSIGISAMLILENVFGYRPCFLCTVQRWLTVFVIVVAVLSLLVNTIIETRYKRDIFSFSIALITFVFLLMTAVGIYHILVERGIVQMSAFCRSADFFVNDVNELSNLMASNTVAPPCDRPQLLFGVSIASWTIMTLLCINVVMVLYWFLKISDNKLKSYV